MGRGAAINGGAGLIDHYAVFRGVINGDNHRGSGGGGGDPLLIAEGDGCGRGRAILDRNGNRIGRNEDVIRTDIIAVGVNGGGAIAGHIHPAQQLAVFIDVINRHNHAGGHSNGGRQRGALGDIRGRGDHGSAFKQRGLGDFSGNAIHFQVIIILETFYGPFGVLAVDAVDGIIQITQLGQTPLQLFDFIPAIAYIQGGILDGRGRRGRAGRGGGRGRLAHIGRGAGQGSCGRRRQGRGSLRGGGNHHHHVYQQRLD